MSNYLTFPVDSFFRWNTELSKASRGSVQVDISNLKFDVYFIYSLIIAYKSKIKEIVPEEKITKEMKEVWNFAASPEEGYQSKLGSLFFDILYANPNRAVQAKVSLAFIRGVKALNASQQTLQQFYFARAIFVMGQNSTDSSLDNLKLALTVHENPSTKSRTDSTVSQKFERRKSVSSQALSPRVLHDALFNTLDRVYENLENKLMFGPLLFVAMGDYAWKDMIIDRDTSNYHKADRALWHLIGLVVSDLGLDPDTLKKLNIEALKRLSNEEFKKIFDIEIQQRSDAVITQVVDKLSDGALRKLPAMYPIKIMEDISAVDAELQEQWTKVSNKFSALRSFEIYILLNLSIHEIDERIKNLFIFKMVQLHFSYFPTRKAERLDLIRTLCEFYITNESYTQEIIKEKVKQACQSYEDILRQIKEEELDRAYYELKAALMFRAGNRVTAQECRAMADMFPPN